jgi:cell division septation protein DedD
VKIPRVLAALATAAMVALPVAVVHATSDAAIVRATDQPTIQPPIVTAQDCAGDKVCVTLTVENPVAGTIILELTGHTPSSKVFVDTGARLRLTIVPGTTTYTGCFLNVSSFVEPDFNTLRVEVASSDIAGLQGTETKSDSFSPCTSTSPTPTPTPPGSPPPSQTPTPPQSPTPTPPHSPTPTPTTSQPAGSTPTPTATPAGGGGLAQTGGFQFGFVLAGLVLLVAGLSVLGVTRARSRSTQP